MSALGKLFEISETQTAMKVEGVVVDLFTASYIVGAYHRVNEKNQKHMRESTIEKLIDVAHLVMGATKTY